MVVYRFDRITYIVLSFVDHELHSFVVRGVIVFF